MSDVVERTRFTREVREGIIREHVRQHGSYNPEVFVREVARSRGRHPAWAWFEWDDGSAAQQHRLWQARMFVQDIHIKFEVRRVVGRASRVVVSQAEAPALISPVGQRQEGGGYVVFNPKSEASVSELSYQGATALRAWLRRYEGVLLLRGGDPESLKKALQQLEG